MISETYTTIQKFGVSKTLLINTLEVLNWSKVEVKTLLQKFLFQINTVFFLTFSSWILTKCIKILSRTTVNIDNNKNALEQQISILEWFLKDHVTLKTGVMMLKIQLCLHRNKLQLKYMKIENCTLNCNDILMYFWSQNWWALGFFQIHKKIVPPQTFERQCT